MTLIKFVTSKKALNESWKAKQVCCYSHAIVLPRWSYRILALVHSMWRYLYKWELNRWSSHVAPDFFEASTEMKDFEWSTLKISQTLDFMYWDNKSIRFIIDNRVRWMISESLSKGLNVYFVSTDHKNVVSNQIIKKHF